jgi:hypothetical protein
MTVTEQIQRDAQKLPAAFQSEVLDFIEYLLAKAERETGRLEEKEWSALSLTQAMRGLEDEDGPAYTTSDLKVVFS